MRERPVLVAVDDFDRLDPTTATDLPPPTETFRDQPVVFILTARTMDVTTLGEYVMAEHRLTPLGVGAAAALLRRQQPPVTGRARYEVLRLAAGNPRALMALSRAFARSTPDTRLIKATYADQTAELPEVTRHALLYAAARLGHEPLATVLAAAGQATEHPDIWKPAVAAGLVELGHDVVFSDPLVAVALYHEAPAATRRQLHYYYADAALPGFVRIGQAPGDVAAGQRRTDRGTA